MVEYIDYRDKSEISVDGLNEETMNIVQSYPFNSQFLWIDFIKPNIVKWHFSDPLTQDEENELHNILINHDKSKWDIPEEVIVTYPEGNATDMYYETFSTGADAYSTSGTAGYVMLSVKEALDILKNRTDDLVDSYIEVSEAVYNSTPGEYYLLNASNNSIEFHLTTPLLGDRNRILIEDVTHSITFIADNNIPIDGGESTYVIDSEDYKNRLYELVYTNNEVGWNLYEIGAFNRTPVETIVVSINGNDDTMNPNMFSPFRTIKAAIEYSKNIATSSHPVKIDILPGIFVEENPLIIDNEYINISGSGSSTTLVLPKNIDEPILSLSSTTQNVGSDILNIGFYGNIDDFNIDNIYTLHNNEYILPYKRSKKFTNEILDQLKNVGINTTSGTNGTSKNITAIDLQNMGAYNIYNCDFVSFQNAININTTQIDDKIYAFIKNSYFENNDICILSDGQNMNIQFDEVKAYNNPIVIDAKNNSFISMSNFLIDNAGIFNETQDIACVTANWAFVLLKTGYVFNTGIIIYADNQSSVLGDVIDAQNINIAYKCNEMSEINIPNTTIETKNITLQIPNTGNNSSITINNLNSRDTKVSEFQLLSFNSSMTVASATLDITKIVNVDIINWANFNVTFNTVGMGNYFFNDVLVGNSLHGSKVCVGNGAADYRNTLLIIGPAMDAGTDGLQTVYNDEQFEFDTTLVDNCLYFTSDSVLNNVPILWHTFTMDVASPLDHNDGGELILEIYDGENQVWNSINNMVTDGHNPYSSAGKNRFFKFLYENVRIDSFARDMWFRAHAPIYDDGKEHYWARIRVIKAFTTKTAIDRVGIMFNTTAYREDGFREHFGTARIWNIIPGFDVSILQQTPIDDNGTSVGYWADQEFYIARPLNTMPNGQKTTFNYVINFPTITDTSSPLMFILKVTTNSSNGGNFKFRIRAAIVQDGMQVYTNKSDAPAYDNRIGEITNTHVAPSSSNVVQSYFIPIDVSNIMTIRHSSKLEVIGADTSLGINITRDATDSDDTHDGDISIVNIEHHFLQALSGQSSSQFVDVTKNIGKSYRVLYIVNTENYNRLDTTDKEVINVMQSKSFIPTLLKDIHVTNTSWIGYDLIYISSNARDSRIQDKLNSAPIGIFINRVEVLSYMNLITSDQYSSINYQYFIQITDNGHYITNGYNEDQIVRLTKYGRTYNYTTLNESDSHVLGTIQLESNKSILLTWAKDEDDLNSIPLPERRVFFGYGDDTLLEDDAVNLIGRSLDWLLHFDER